jgi:hypothetical protein
MKGCCQVGGFIKMVPESRNLLSRHHKTSFMISLSGIDCFHSTHIFDSIHTCRKANSMMPTCLLETKRMQWMNYLPYMIFNSDPIKPVQKRRSAKQLSGRACCEWFYWDQWITCGIKFQVIIQSKFARILIHCETWTKVKYWDEWTTSWNYHELLVHQGFAEQIYCAQRIRVWFSHLWLYDSLSSKRFDSIRNGSDRVEEINS